MKIFSKFLIALLIISCSVIHPKNDSEKVGLIGKVKKITGTTRTFDGELIKIESSEFNKSGFLKKRYTYTENNKTEVISKMKYDFKGNLKSEVVTTNRNDEKIELKYQTKYENGLLVELYGTSILDDITETHSIKYFYDNDKRIIKEVVEIIAINNDETSAFSFKEISNYDSQEYIKDRVIEYSRELEIEPIKYIYDRNHEGAIIKVREFDNKNLLKETIDYKYKLDKKKNWINREIIIREKITSITERKIEYY